ncbi:uncharacterized protein A4U43_C04F33800 [Asparagus officinalis]|uniref:Uncharacterized protein n=1 Tax=Asparagus officinalis TaxID=4686 RepID=A0A5P1F5M4_ASPOF|nr:uncharacterized protein A4U43_C04F33800 [Asparagus officinalis]
MERFGGVATMSVVVADGSAMSLPWKLAVQVWKCLNLSSYDGGHEFLAGKSLRGLRSEPEPSVWAGAGRVIAWLEPGKTQVSGLDRAPGNGRVVSAMPA